MCKYKGSYLWCPMKVTVAGNLHSPPAWILRENGLSESMHVGTRNMVNYA